MPGNDRPGEDGQPGEATGSGRDPDGHYATLGQSPDATLAQICSAYRQRVLRAHPDKGGNSKDFIAIRNAFAVLGDPDRRARYDGRHEPQTGGTQQAAAAADVASGAAASSDPAAGAKAAYATMITTPKESWGNLLAGLPNEVVEALSGLLAANPHRRQKVEKSSEGGEAAAAGADQGPGLTQWPSGDFHVKVSWRRFSVQAGSPIRSLEQAVNLHIALTNTRVAALARHKAILKHFQDIGVADPAAEAELCPPLLESELLSVLHAEPMANLTFASDMTNRSNGNVLRIQNAWTPSLASAMDFRLMIRRVVNHRDGEKRKVVPLMKARAKHDREVRDAVWKDAEREIEREKNRRASAVSRRPGPEIAAAAQLALPETAHTAAAQLAQALVVVKNAAEREGAEVSRLRDELLHEQESRRREFEDRRRAEEAHRRKLEEVRQAAAAAEAQRTDKVERDLAAANERHDRTVAQMAHQLRSLTSQVLTSGQDKKDLEDELEKRQKLVDEHKRSLDQALQQQAVAQPRRAQFKIIRETAAPAPSEARDYQFEAIKKQMEARTAAAKNVSHAS
eukprot:gnl/TRDRNA2_/TRDRNA2_91583_c0_seq1.p1 gnl/TRDRNA2_/TRDRNA2_91583_c0~~gnl/TRDRNA2_/TRDRNA2_91583_c0_seq1.p1  ORF type:complete len:592 (+),score=104.23 gnl/TRDRNA2_/TRDRNA2_91583_c0_seq1:78-1778(+)